MSYISSLSPDLFKLVPVKEEIAMGKVNFSRIVFWVSESLVHLSKSIQRIGLFYILSFIILPKDPPALSCQPHLWGPEPAPQKASQKAWWHR